MRGRRGWVRLLGGIAFAALLMSGCGPSRDEVSTDDGTAVATTDGAGLDRSPGEARLAKAAAATASIATGRIWTESSLVDGGPEQTMVTETAFDADADQIRLEATYGEGASTVLVLDGDRGYAYLPEFADAFGGKPWVGYSLKDSSYVDALVGEVINQDPGAVLTLLERGGRSVTELGTEDVRGVSTDHVAAEIVVADALDQATPAVRRRVQRAADLLGIGLEDIEPIPVDVWIGDDGLVRRVRVARDLPSQEGQPASQISTTVEMYDLGKPVTIEVPDPSEVGDPPGGD